MKEEIKQLRRLLEDLEDEYEKEWGGSTDYVKEQIKDYVNTKF